MSPHFESKTGKDLRLFSLKWKRRGLKTILTSGREFSEGGIPEGRS